jgi:hypothetical protein
VNQRSPPARAPQSALPDHTPDLDNGRTNILVSEELWPHLRDATVAAATRMTGAARPLPAVAGRSINHTSRDDAVGSVPDIPEVTFCCTYYRIGMKQRRNQANEKGLAFDRGQVRRAGRSVSALSALRLRWVDKPQRH